MKKKLKSFGKSINSSKRGCGLSSHYSRILNNHSTSFPSFVGQIHILLVIFTKISWFTSVSLVHLQQQCFKIHEWQIYIALTYISFGSYPFSPMTTCLLASLSDTIYDRAVTASFTTRFSLECNRAHMVRTPPSSTNWSLKRSKFHSC